ncbi:MAG: BrnA antitoxin family protein [Gammaproteobacteria bacterium]|nr:BrnA antitoxin family protein [Gammaproteobacteria bacterium]MDD9963836.1 BrnA antitoxin family protein [Gammaproteobacteria bacterium]MDE0270502.1 BrnA antitoxin family protein [Gammaproteobacteria bacterium]
MKKGNSSKVTEKQASQLRKLASMSDDEIDTSDISEVLDWSGAKRGLLYRPTKQQITLRLDTDVLAWFRAAVPDGRGYQTEINRVLREHARRVSSQGSA